MSLLLAGVLGFVLTLVFIAVGFPVAVAMGVMGALGLWFVGDLPLVGYTLGAVPFEAIFPYSFSVIPLFVMMGVFAARAGLSKSLFELVNGFCGHFRGGLAISTVGASAGFGSICGSSLATVATIGRVAMPEMRRYGYDDSLSSASVAAGGTLGVLIPPSIILVIYGLLTQTSIGGLFIGAILPGILGTLLYMLAVWFWVRWKPDLAPPAARTPMRERFAMLPRVAPVVLLFGTVIGGIYTGYFSTTEAAAVGAVGAFLLAAIMGAVNVETLREVVVETMAMTGMIFLILIGAGLFNNFLESTGVTYWLVDLVQGSDLSPTMLMILILIFYIVLGCFMDAMSMILLTVPLLAPVAVGVGFDMIWFGILIVTVAEIGLITPPVGMNLFVVQGTTPNLSQATVIRGILPFILADIVRIVILVAFPIVILWLPSQM